MKGAPFEKYFILYLPWLFSVLFAADSVLSYFIAWLGSFLIFYLTMSGWVKPLPTDLTKGEQLMRPIFLVQIIFIGYSACTTIFYFFDLLGYRDFHKTSDFFLINYDALALAAQCQRYYCLGHAAFVTGVLSYMKYPIKHKYTVDNERLANLLFYTALITLPVSTMFTRLPGLSQFSVQFNSLSFIAGTLALAFAIPMGKIWNTVICAFLYSVNFYAALTSGFKEPIIISVLVLGVFLYPTYKKLVVVVFVPAIIALFVFLPSYIQTFRQNAWAGGVAADEASQLAIDETFGKNSTQGQEGNWDFLTHRLSEVDMFAKFVKSTPDKIDFYGFKILKQSAVAIVPRVVWPSKPVTEELVMQRVYDAGVASMASDVSAKPAYIVHAYLSDGTIGVFVGMFLYGAIAQLISAYAEKLFGGYVLGTALIFSGLFQIMWRGLSFEFLINTVFWSFISMLVIHKILVSTHVLEPV